MCVAISQIRKDWIRKSQCLHLPNKFAIILINLLQNHGFIHNTSPPPRPDSFKKSKTTVVHLPFKVLCLFSYSIQTV